MSPERLAGRRILITRPEEDAVRWVERLRKLGAEPIVMPCLEIVPLADADTARTLRRALDRASWLVLSSRRGVEAVHELIGDAIPPRVQVAVVGPTSARAAAELLGRVDIVSTESTARALARTLVERLRERGGAEHVVVAGAANGRTDDEVALAEADVAVTRIALYATVPAAPAAVKRDLGADGVQHVLLASPSAAEGLANRALVPADVQVITIGPTTTAAAAAAGLTVSAEARHPDLDGMLEAIP